MKTVVSFSELDQALEKMPAPVGFVPTMGFLHEGHLSLVRAARAECASVVVSIFVNPTQFGPNEDLSRYPRDLPRDLELLKHAKVDLIWMPTAEEMYPPGFQTWVTVDEITQPLEGSMRPGHFRGVATVVAKLFNAVQPDKAYFGQKDAQQAVVIRQMSRDLDYPLEIIVCPTVREPDGLAMSSRNIYLSPDERKSAVILSKALFQAKVAFEGGQHDADRLRQVVLDAIATEPAQKVQYVSCAHPVTLQELEGEVKQALLSLAVTIGKTHLIDNIIL
jgi:pantoate--beta-alanine ligase